MRVLLILSVVLAGCAAPSTGPTPTPDASGPIDLSEKLGLMLVDLETRETTIYTQKAALAWMSENATVVTWTEEGFAVAVDRASGGREIGPLTIWARVYDNGTGLELVDKAANLREIVSGTTRSTTPVPPSPIEGFPWTAASDDLGVLGGEYVVSGRTPCASDIILRAQSGERTVGCHLRIAPDGRAAWTEATSVRLRERNGTIVPVTGFGAGNPANGTYVGHENPVFTREDVIMLRLTGGSTLELSEIVGRDGEVLAKVDGPRRVALHDASADGRYLLVRTFGG